MKPDRIILAELRGDESFYFIRNCASGHRDLLQVAMLVAQNKHGINWH